MANRDTDPAFAVARAGLALRRHSDPAIRAVGDTICDWWWSGASMPLDKLLGITTVGGVSQERAMKLRRRDALIRRAWQAVPEWRDLPASRAARLMAADARRYETTRWPRERDSISPPAAQPASTWWEILQNDLPIPGGKRIEQILEMEIH